VSADDFGLDALAKDLTHLANIMTNEVTKSMQQVGMTTKKVHQKAARKGPMGAQYAPTIDYTVREYGAFGQGVIEVEIGPNLARYGGKTGKGGLVPSMGILDDPEATGSIATPPSRARRVAEKFAETEVIKRLEMAVDQSAKKVNL